MAARRRFVRRRRFRTRWETDRIIQCSTAYNVAKNATCSNTCVSPATPGVTSQLLDVIPLLTMTIPFQAVPVRLPSTMATRFMRFGGMKFQSSWWTDPGEWFDSENCGVPISALMFVLSIWEALVILPLAQRSNQAPAYLPALADASDQSADLGDRLLWKRVLHLPMWGFTPATQALTQLEHTGRESADVPQVVKVRTRVDDKHGIFLCRQFVHNIVFGGNAPCNDPGDLGSCNIPVHNNFWGTMYFRAS